MYIRNIYVIYIIIYIIYIHICIYMYIYDRTLDLPSWLFILLGNHGTKRQKEQTMFCITLQHSPSSEASS